MSTRAAAHRVRPGGALPDMVSPRSVLGGMRTCTRRLVRVRAALETDLVRRETLRLRPAVVAVMRGWWRRRRSAESICPMDIVLPAVLRRVRLRPLWPAPERMVVRGTVPVPHRSELVLAQEV